MYTYVISLPVLGRYFFGQGDTQFRSLVVPGGGCRNEIILQGVMTPMGVLPNGQECFRKKGYVIGAYVHTPRQRNSTYVQTVRRSIYDTR